MSTQERNQQEPKPPAGPSVKCTLCWDDPRGEWLEDETLSAGGLYVKCSADWRHEEEKDHG